MTERYYVVKAENGYYVNVECEGVTRDVIFQDECDLHEFMTKTLMAELKEKGKVNVMLTLMELKETADDLTKINERLEQEKERVEQEQIIEYNIEDTDIAEMDGLYESTEHSLTQVPNKFQRLIMDAMTYMVEIFSYVAQMFVSFLSVIYMIILSITGPLTFVLAIVPMFRSGIGSWLARYIQIMLWTPISHMIVIIMNYFHIVILRTSLENSIVVTWPTTVMLCLGLVMTIALFKIPTLCEWIVESTGGTAFNTAVNKAASKIGTMVVKQVSK